MGLHIVVLPKKCDTLPALDSSIALGGKGLSALVPNELALLTPHPTPQIGHSPHPHPILHTPHLPVYPGTLTPGYGRTGPHQPCLRSPDDD